MKKLYILLSVLCLFPLVAGGQALKGSYFSEYSPYRNKLNPAFVPRSSYLGFTPLTNMSAGLTSNIGMSNFLYPSADGTLLTFMHPDISADSFLNSLPANPHLDVDVDMDILNIGFFTGKNSFWSIGLGVKVDAEANIPKELFTFLKKGASSDPQEYHIKDLSIIQNAYLEASLGYSHDFSDLLKGLRAGARVKFLAAIDRADVRVDNLNLRMASDKWAVSADASAYLAMKGMNVTLEDNSFGYDFNTSAIGLAGMGAAFDLGLEYRYYINRFFDSVRISAAVTDLGFINYRADAIQRFRSGASTEFEGFNDVTFGEDLNYQETLDKITEDMMEILNFEEVSDKAALKSRIRPNLYIGAEIPFLWNRMSLGLLYNAKFGYTSTRNELTLALNARPGKWLNIGVNYSMLNASKSIGWILELIPRSGIGCFIGSDYTFMEVTNLPIGGFNLPVLPVNEANFNIRFGCYIALGNKYDEKGQAKIERRMERKEARRNR